MYVEASTSCPRCRQPIPLNGASDSVLCGSCQTPMETSPSFWQSILADEMPTITQLPEKEGRTSTVMMGDRTVQLKYGRLAARCASCKKPFDPARFAPASEKGKLFCGGCGTSATVRRAPSWLTDMQPLATFVVGEALAATSAVPENKPKEPTQIHCIQCGAPMQIDGKERLFNCKHCNGQIYIPDDLWLRLNPAVVTQSWFIVLDIGDAMGAVSGSGPNGIDDLNAIAGDPRGNAIIAYEADNKGEAGHTGRIACVDRRGLLLWVQDGIEMSDKVSLVPSPPDGSLLFVDRNRHTGRYINAATGQPIRTIGDRELDELEERGGEVPRDGKKGAIFDPHDHDGVVVDYDGTILVLKRWDHEHYVHTLRRFAPDGTPVPVWPSAKKPPTSHPEWTELKDFGVAAPSSAHLAFGWNGLIYFYEDKDLAMIARDGRVVRVVSFPKDVVQDIYAIGADRAGTTYVLFEHAHRIGDSTMRNVLRMAPDGRWHVWLGPHGDGGMGVGRYDRHMAVMPDGTLLLGYDEQLRGIGPDGRVAWRTPAAAAADADFEKDLEQLRRPKKSAQDTG